MGSTVETPAVFQVSCDRAACKAKATSPTRVPDEWTIVSKGKFPRGRQAVLCPKHSTEYDAFWKADA